MLDRLNDILPRFLLAMAMALVLAGLSGTARADELVTVEGAWSRALPPVVKVGAAYLKVSNAGAAGVVVIGAAASIAERAELHEHTHVDGMMRMRQVTRVEVPAGATVSFEPHGLHVMLFGLREPLKAGSQYQLTLRFASGREITSTVQVKKQTP